MLKADVLVLLNSVLLAVATVDLQQTSPIAKVCPGGNITFSCTVTAAGNGTVVLNWFDPDDQSDRRFILTNDINMDEDAIVGAFTTKVVKASNDTIISTATINELNLDDMSAGITCSDNNDTKETNYVSNSAADPPSAPVNITASVISPNVVQLSWNAPPTSNSSCPPATYTITITAASSSLDPLVINTTDTTTKTTVSNLTETEKYYFTVAAMDVGGRKGKNSKCSDAITINKPEPVVNLDTYTISCSSEVIVVWMPPPPSSRPPVTGYKISYNTTGGVLVNETNYTMFSFASVAPGRYSVSVWAINTLGDGKAMSFVVVVESPPTTLSPFTSTTVYIMIGVACAITTIAIMFLLIRCTVIRRKAGCGKTALKCFERETTSSIEEQVNKFMIVNPDRDECRVIRSEYSFVTQEPDLTHHGNTAALEQQFSS